MFTKNLTVTLTLPSIPQLGLPHLARDSKGAEDRELPEKGLRGPQLPRLLPSDLLSPPCWKIIQSSPLTEAIVDFGAYVWVQIY